MGRKPTNITIEDIRKHGRIRSKRYYKKHKEEITKKRNDLKNEKINN